MIFLNKQDLFTISKQNVEAWRVYEDGEYFIIAGTVSKNKDTAFLFSSYYLKETKGANPKLSLKYFSLGNKKSDYISNHIPKDLLPHSIMK